MFTIKDNVVFEQFINKSRFITYLFPITSEDEAKEKLEYIRKKHYDATHNCYSYIVGTTANIMKFSDDGEPTGTAGIVIHDVLQKNNLTNILAIVTRYYGGIKLGAGGLVRAYSSSTALALEEATISEIKNYLKLSLTCDYSILGLVEKTIEEFEVLNKDFSQTVNIILNVPDSVIESLKEKLIDISKDTIELKII